MTDLGHASKSCPFPGLRPFRKEESRFFFGRDVEIEHLHDALLGPRRFVAVVGSSGSGKSSLVEAGLLPRLLDPAESEGPRWRILAMRPMGAPIDRLAEAIARLALAEGPVGFRSLHPDVVAMRFRAGLRRDTEGLVDALAEAVEDPRAPVLVAVDQFEELFRYEPGLSTPEGTLPLYRDEAQSFATLMLSAMRSARRRIHVLLTMRSDFIGECGRYRGLAEAVSASQYLVPTMVREQMSQAILGPLCTVSELPVNRWSEVIDPALLPRLLNAAADERAADPLPVLQHALMRTWQIAAARAEPDPGGTTLRVVPTVQDYEKAGGMERALSLHADEMLASVIDTMRLDASAFSTAADLERLVEHLFRALTAVDVEGRAVRRPQKVEDLAAVAGVQWQDVRRAIEPFRAPGVSFLTPYTPGWITEATPIDIGHEALIRRWNRISSTERARDGRPAGWLAREQEDGLLWRSLLVQAAYEQSHLSPAVTRQVARWFDALPSKDWTYRHFVRTRGSDVSATEDTPQAAYDRVRRMLDRSRAVQVEEDRRLKETEQARSREKRQRVETIESSAAALIDEAWRAHQGWRLAADSLKKTAQQKTRQSLLLFPLVAAAVGALGAFFHQERGHLAFVFIVAAMAIVAAHPLLRMAENSATSASVYARAAYDAIRSECYRYAAGIGDYAQSDAPRVFVGRLAELVRGAEQRGLAPHPVPRDQVADVGLPPPAMTASWYVKNRLMTERNFLESEGVLQRKAVARARMTASLFALLAALLALLAALGSYGLVEFSSMIALFVPVATTASVGAAVVGLKGRHAPFAFDQTAVLMQLDLVEAEYNSDKLKESELITAAENLLMSVYGGQPDTWLPRSTPDRVAAQNGRSRAGRSEKAQSSDQVGRDETQIEVAWQWQLNLAAAARRRVRADHNLATAALGMLLTAALLGAAAPTFLPYVLQIPALLAAVACSIGGCIAGWHMLEPAAGGDFTRIRVGAALIRSECYRYVGGGGEYANRRGMKQRFQARLEALYTQLPYLELVASSSKLGQASMQPPADMNVGWYLQHRLLPQREWHAYAASRVRQLEIRVRMLDMFVAVAAALVGAAAVAKAGFLVALIPLITTLGSGTAGLRFIRRFTTSVEAHLVVANRLDLVLARHNEGMLPRKDLVAEGEDIICAAVTAGM